MGGVSPSGKTILDPGQVKDLHIGSDAAIQVDKCMQLHLPDTNFGVAYAGTPSARHEIVWVAKGSGVVRGVHGKVNAAGGSTAITITLKKNGTTMLSGDVTIGNTTNVCDGTLSVTTFVAGDVLSLDMAGTFTGAQGPYAWITLVEAAAPAT